MNPKLLVVDDTPENIDLLRQVLQAMDCKILVANSGERALDIIARNPPELVLLDVMMPGLDGFETCRRIKASPSTADIPVIFVTARQDDISQGFQAGGSDYIIKPINADEVLARVRHHLERLQLMNQLRALNEELETKVRERTARLAVANRQLREEVNERRFMQDRLRYLAEHDFITRVYNRNALDAHATEVIERIQRERGQAICLLLDIDHFRLVNETCGCIAGDELLREVGEMVANTLDATDFLARLGGDRFAVVGDHRNRESGMALARLIQQQSEAFRFYWEGRQFELTLTIALVDIDEHVTSFDQLLMMADEVMYLAKRQGRKSIRCYDENTRDQTAHRSTMNWALTLVDALKLDQFQVHVQQIAPLAQPTDGHPGLKMEALVRLVGQAGGLLYPDAFIPAAERFHLISRIDRWVIQQVMQFLGREQSQLPSIQSVAVNLSAVSVREPDLTHFIAAQLERSGIDPRVIVFEITETENIVNVEATRQFMQTIKALGCRFALDDFGSGFASFNYLRELPFDLVKIDGVFIRDLDKSDTHESMVRSIVEIAAKMQVEVVAEFVEHQGIVDKLQQLGVHWAQGYYYHKPQLLSVKALSQMAASDLR